MRTTFINLTSKIEELGRAYHNSTSNLASILSRRNVYMFLFILFLITNKYFFQVKIRPWPGYLYQEENAFEFGLYLKQNICGDNVDRNTCFVSCYYIIILLMILNLMICSLLCKDCQIVPTVQVSNDYILLYFYFL